MYLNCLEHLPSSHNVHLPAVPPFFSSCCTLYSLMEYYAFCEQRDQCLLDPLTLLVADWLFILSFVMCFDLVLLLVFQMQVEKMKVIAKQKAKEERKKLEAEVRKCLLRSIVLFVLKLK